MALADQAWNHAPSCKHIRLFWACSGLNFHYQTMLVRQSRRLSLLTPSCHYRQMASTSARRSRPVNWKAAAPEPLPGTTTFAAQSTLPKLPVPALQDTLGRLKETLKPISWSDAEYSTVSKKIDDFAIGKGPELHQRLLERAGQRPHWLEEWWDDAGYLGYRDSVSLNIYISGI